MTIHEIKSANRSAILEVAKNYGAYNVRIFGSVARGESTKNSDLDLLVDLENGRTLFDLGGLHADLEEMLHCTVDIVTENGLDPLIREQVLHEAVPL